MKGMTFANAVARGLDIRMMAAAGMLSDASFIHKFGENPAIGATQETVWDHGGLYPWQAQGAGIPMVFKSTLAADDVLSTGARYVTIMYLNAAGEDKIITIETDGDTDVAIADDIYLPYRMFVSPGPNGEAAVGSGGTAAGVLSITNAAGTVTYTKILVGNNQTLMSVFSIPAGKVGYVFAGDTTVGEGKEVAVKFYGRPSNGAFLVLHSLLVFEGTYRFDFHGPFPIPAGTDLDVRGLSSAVGSNVTATFDLLLVDA